MLWNKEINKIIENYKREIKIIEDAELNDFSNVEQGIKISRKYLQNLRETIRSGTFKNKGEEIKFFKEQKPFVYSRLKFYTKLYHFLIRRPAGTLKSQRNFIDLVIKKLQEHNNLNLNFIKYYREHSTILDVFYFLRGNDNISVISNTSHFYTDVEFSTSHDNSLAKIMEYDLLFTHCSQKFISLRHSSKNKKTGKYCYCEKSKLEWNATKTDLIDLIYALQTSGAIKDGTARIKEMATAYEQMFNLDLGNYYRIYIEIRERKVERIKFIDKLNSSINARMELEDE